MTKYCTLYLLRFQENSKMQFSAAVDQVLVGKTVQQFQMECDKLQLVLPVPPVLVSVQLEETNMKITKHA